MATACRRPPTVAIRYPPERAVAGISRQKSPNVGDGTGPSPPTLPSVDELLVTEGRALKHVQVREYVRTLVTGAAPGSPAPSERELVHRFGVARMTVRQAMDALVVEGLLERIPGRGTFVGPPAARREQIDQLHRGDGATRPAGRVADPPRASGAGRTRRRPRPEPHRGRRRHPLAPAAPRRRRTDVRRGRLPQRGADPRLPAERDADQPVRRAGVARPAPDLGRGLDQRRRRRDEDEASCSRSTPGAPVLRHSRRGLWRARRSSRSRAPSTGPTATRCGSRWARRADAPASDSQPAERRDDVAGLLAHPHRVGAAEVGLDVERVHGRVGSPQSWHSGQRPTVSNSASCTSWATSPATYSSPSGHCSAHHLRWATASSRADTAAAVGLLDGPGGRRAPGHARRTAGRCPCPHHAPGSKWRGSDVDAAGSYSAGMGPALLEVTVLDPRDVPGAEEGGADRLHLATGAGGTVARARASSPRSAARPSSRCSSLLRLNDTWSTTGGELTRLVGLAEDYLGSGAERGLVRLPRRRPRGRHRGLRAPRRPLPGVPWTFGRAVDDTLEPAPLLASARATLPGLVAVRSAGSPRGLDVGLRRAARPRRRRPGRRAAADARRRAARRARAVVRARRGAPVPPRAPGATGCVVQGRTSTPATCASWRLLLDDAVDRAVARGRLSAMILIDPPNAAGARAAVVAPGQRRVVRRAARVRRHARHPAARLRPRPLRRAGRVVRRRGGRRRRPGHAPASWSPGCIAAGLRRRKGGSP